MKKNDSHNISSGYVSRETLDCSLALYREHEDRFRQLVNLWLWWNKPVNLFSRNITSDLLVKHIRHCLILSCEMDVTEGATYVDAGSGGGLPGLPMALANPAAKFLLVDKVKKKQLVQRDIIRKLNLSNVESCRMDISEIGFQHSVHFISKHAFDLNDLISALKNCSWVSIHMLKGEDVFSEVSNSVLEHFKINVKEIYIPDDPFFLNKYIVSIEKLNQ